jgi:hypothetical protein
MMTEFRGKRVTQEYTQSNAAPPERVFPLLCPVREADWVPGWQYRMIHSLSGVAEAGCVFATPNEDGSETIWMVTEYEPTAFRIAFAWVNPGVMSAWIRISLTGSSQGTTKARICYSYTGLSDAGNREVERYNQDWFQHKMRSWEGAINHYLQSGKLLDAAAWNEPGTRYQVSVSVERGRLAAAMSPPQIRRDNHHHNQDGDIEALHGAHQVAPALSEDIADAGDA